MRISSHALGAVMVLFIAQNVFAEEANRLHLQDKFTCAGELRGCVEQHKGNWIPSHSDIQWEVTTVEKKKQRSFVRLAARWNGLRTVGTSSVVTLDEAGRVLFVDRPSEALSVKPVSRIIAPEAAAQVALQAIHEKTGGALPTPPRITPEHVVMVDGNVGVQTYEVIIGAPAHMTAYKVYVDAETGHIHWIHNPTLH